MAARYLLGLGQTKLAMIAGITHNDRVAARRDGFVAELEKQGIERSKIPLLESAYKVEGGRTMGTIAGEYLLATAAWRQHLRQRELPLRLVVRSSTAPIAR